MVDINPFDGDGVDLGGAITGAAALAALGLMGKKGYKVYANDPLIAGESLKSFFRGALDPTTGERILPGKKLLKDLRAAKADDEWLRDSVFLRQNLDTGEQLADDEIRDLESYRTYLADIDEPYYRTNAGERALIVNRGLRNIGEGQINTPAATRTAVRYNKVVEPDLFTENAQPKELEKVYTKIRKNREWSETGQTSLDPAAAQAAGVPVGALGSDGLPLDIYVRKASRKSGLKQDVYAAVDINDKATYPLDFEEVTQSVKPAGRAFGPSLSRFARSLNLDLGILPLIRGTGKNAGEISKNKLKALNLGARDTGHQVETVMDLADPAVRQQVLSDTLNQMVRNYTTASRADALLEWDKLKANPISKQLAFLRQFRQQADFRKFIYESFAPDAKKLSEILGLPEDEVLGGIASAYTRASSASDPAGANRRLKQVFDAIIANPQNPTKWSENKTTAAGRFVSKDSGNALLNRMMEDIIDPTKQTMGRMSLAPEAALFDVNTTLREPGQGYIESIFNAKKEGELRRALRAGGLGDDQVDILVADTADIIKLFNLTEAEADQLGATIKAVFSAFDEDLAPVYGTVLKAMRQALEEGHLAQVRRGLLGRKRRNYGLFNYQGGLQKRRRNYAEGRKPLL